MLNAVQGAQDGIPGDFPSVAAAPLDVADPDGDAGEFSGKFVDFNAANVVRAGLHQEFSSKSKFQGFDVDLLLQIAKGLEGKVEKIPRTAGGVENLKEMEVQQKALIGRAGFPVFLGARSLALRGSNNCFDGLPFGQQRFGNQRMDEFGDGAGVSVVSAERGTGGRIEAALEEGAKYSGVDGSPIHVGGGGVQRGQIICGQNRNVDSLEETAIEPGDVVIAVFAAGFLLHGDEELVDTFSGFVGVAAGAFEDFGEDAAGEQVFVFGKDAEQALNQKMSDTLAVKPAFAHVSGESGKVPGGLGGDGGGGFFRTEFWRIGEDPAQNLPLFGVDQFFDANFARLVRVAGEGGVDDDAFPVGDDEQRRIIELQGVVGKLMQCGGEVAPRLFVFPAETAPFPDICPAVAATGFFGPVFKAVVVRIARLVHAEQFAQIVKVRLRPAAFGEFVVFPEVDEFFGRHGFVSS